MSRKQKRQHRGSFLVEAAAAITVLGIIAALATSASLNFAKVQDHYHKRMAASWAAEAQMERYIAGAAIDSPPPDGAIAENISLSTTVEAGTGQWEAFNLVVVSARIENRHGAAVVESVRCYLPQEAKP
jgi:type II secretory pathway pseudopilin PulG